MTTAMLSFSTCIYSCIWNFVHLSVAFVANMQVVYCCLHIFDSSCLHIFDSRCSHIFDSRGLHIFDFRCLHVFDSCCLHVFDSRCLHIFDSVVENPAIFTFIELSSLVCSLTLYVLFLRLYDFQPAFVQQDEGLRAAMLLMTLGFGLGRLELVLIGF